MGVEGRPRDSIAIKGLTATGYHGVFEDERATGQPFVVDLVAHLDTHPAAKSDALEDTVDYGQLAAEIVAVVTGPPVQLIETLAQRVAETVLAHERIQAVEVMIHKPKAPMPVAFGDVVLTVRRERSEVVPAAVAAPAQAVAATPAPLAAPATIGGLLAHEPVAAAPAPPPVSAGQGPAPTPPLGVPVMAGSATPPGPPVPRPPATPPVTGQLPQVGERDEASGQAAAVAEPPGPVEQAEPAQAPEPPEAPPEASEPPEAPDALTEALSVDDMPLPAQSAPEELEPLGETDGQPLMRGELPLPPLPTDDGALPPVPIPGEPLISVRDQAPAAEPPAPFAAPAEPTVDREESGVDDHAPVPPEEPAVPSLPVDGSGEPRISDLFQARAPEAPAVQHAGEPPVFPPAVDAPTLQAPIDPSPAAPSAPAMPAAPIEEETEVVPTMDTGSLGLFEPTIGLAPVPPRGPYAPPPTSQEIPQVMQPASPLDRVPNPPADVVLALGGNVGEVPATLRKAIAMLAAIDGLEILTVSPLARTAAVGEPDQPDFFNAVVIGRCSIAPRALLAETQRIEMELGRVREERWGPRTIDIDIITFGSLTEVSDDLTIPHPLAGERAFVLLPWANAAPHAILPGLGGGPVAQLAEAAPDRAGVRWLSLDWVGELTDTAPPAGAPDAG